MPSPSPGLPARRAHIPPPADPADPIPQPHPPEVRDPADEPPKPISDPPPVPTQLPQ